MKRVKETVYQIVKEGQSIDENGNPVYPVMQEPLIMGIFGAPEALLSVLKERPIVVLNLLQISKALDIFWNQFSHIWIDLIDALVEKAWPMPESADVYPFFVITNRRIFEKTSALFLNQPEETPTSFITGNSTQRALWYKTLLRPYLVIGLYLGQPETQFSIIYYDAITQMIIDLFQHMEGLSSFFVHLFPVRLFFEEYLYELGFKFTQGVVCLSEGFLVKRGDAGQPVALKPVNLVTLQRVVAWFKEVYDPLTHRTILALQEVEVTRAKDIPNPYLPAADGRPLKRGVVGLFPLRVGEALTRIQRMILTLTNIIDSGEEIPSASLIEVPIDKDMSRPYRDLLYHPQQGLYNTQEKQKEFFMALLTELRNVSTKDAMIDKFGDRLDRGKPLSCAVCNTNTFMVDRVLKLAFCDIACWNQYDKK